MANTAQLADADHPQSRAREWLARFPRALPAILFLAIAAITGFSVYTIERTTPGELEVRLYDGGEQADKLVITRPLATLEKDRIEEPVTIAGREISMVVETRDNPSLSPNSMVTLIFGLSLASILTLMVRLLAQQAAQDRARLEFFEEQHSIRNSLSHELNHRVKNTLANVLSILSLTRRRAHDLDDFADSLEGRIRALSATHDLLTSSDWGTTPIRAVVEAEMRHFVSAASQNVTVEGPDVELAPKDALSFGLAIHELATNAAKYGALSVAEGRVSVRWQLSADNIAEVEWRESGGPSVPETRPRGFGTELIEKIVSHELKHRVELEFEAEGVRCAINVPVRPGYEFRLREDAVAQA